MTPEEHLAVPYILVVEAVEGPDGDWVCQVTYPELPGCSTQASSPLDALDQLDRLRERYIRRRLAEGDPVPVPRPPLAYLIPTSAVST